jgi:hypothetical protein
VRRLPTEAGSVLFIAVRVGATASLADAHRIASKLEEALRVASTVPANGDVNPYGIVQLSRRATGKLHAGDLLVSNFNDKANNQGTGTTIVEITPAGKQSLFSRSTRARCREAAPEASDSRPR